MITVDSFILKVLISMTAFMIMCAHFIDGLTDWIQGQHVEWSIETNRTDNNTQQPSKEKDTTLQSMCPLVTVNSS